MVTVPESLGRRYYDRFWERPGRGWLGHVAFVAMLFRYGVGAVFAVATVVFQTRWLPWEVRAAAWPCAILYLLFLFWWHVLWGLHAIYPCERCAAVDDAARFARWWRWAGRLFRGYHLAADPAYWFYFQIAAIVAVSLTAAGLPWLWASFIPLGVVWVGVTWSTWFHTRFGWACPRCHGEEGPEHGTITFGPSQKRRISW